MPDLKDIQAARKTKAVRELIRAWDLQQVQDERMGKVPGGPDWVPALQCFKDNHTVPIMLEVAKVLTSKSYLAVEWPSSSISN